MSLSIENLKFTIFGSGHDFTLIDSGKGESKFFSHPYVPLGSVNYAGQYYFLVPDENGDMFDCVKDDIAHCTFDPVLGSAFDTEGTATVKVTYHREYIHAEETYVVHKTMKQNVEVVDHGTVSQSGTNCDLYTDGYLFWRPRTINEVTSYALQGIGTPTKTSCIPWRVSSIGDGIYAFLTGSNLTDISELETADLSNCTTISRMFSTCSNLTDMTPISGWDVSNVTSITLAFAYSAVTDLSFLAKWNVSNVTSLESTFSTMQNLRSLHGLENWDVSNVTTLAECFTTDTALADISALAKWDVSKVTTLQNTFSACSAITSLDGLANWNVGAVTNTSSCFRNCSSVDTFEPLKNWTLHPTSMTYMFDGCASVRTLEGLEKFDVSGVTNMTGVFENMPKLVTLDGVEDWDVSNVTMFYLMFAYDPWIADILAINEWDMSSAYRADEMFAGNASILTLDGVILDLSRANNISAMFGCVDLYYVDQLGKSVWANAYYYFDYDGNRYSKLGLTETVYPKDASNAENWTVNISGANAFSRGTWLNKPSWD